MKKFPLWYIIFRICRVEEAFPEYVEERPDHLHQQLLVGRGLAQLIKIPLQQFSVQMDR